MVMGTTLVGIRLYYSRKVSVCVGVPAYIHLITSIFIPYRPSEIWFCKFVSFLSEEVHLGKCSRWHWSSRSNHGQALYSNFLFLNVTLICSLRFHNLWIQFWTVACFLRLFLSGLKVHLCFLLLKPTTRSILGRCLLFLCLRSSMYRQPVFNLLLSKEQTIFLSVWTFLRGRRVNQGKNKTNLNPSGCV